MALGLLGLAYGFLSAPSTVEDAKAIIAAHGEDSHATGHETAAHAEDHDAAHDQRLLDQMRNRPWSAFYVSALFSFLIALGVFFLLSNLNLIHLSLWQIIKVWWPVGLIAIGLSLFLVPGGKGK